MASWRYEISLLVLKKISQHSKRNFVSAPGHVISSILFSNEQSSYTIIMVYGIISCINNRMMYLNKNRDGEQRQWKDRDTRNL